MFFRYGKSDRRKCKTGSNAGNGNLKFPNYKSVTLKNGIKLIIVEDREQPTFNMSLLIPGGSSLDGGKTGIASFTATY